MLSEILLNILDLNNHQKLLYGVLVWYFMQLQCNKKYIIPKVETSLSSPVRVHLLSGELLSLFPEAFAPLHHPMSARQSNSHTDDARAAWKPWPLVEATKTMWPKLPQNTWQPLGWG